MQFVQRGRESGTFFNQHIQRRGQLVQQARDNIALISECAGEAVQFVNRGEDVAALIGERSHEVVQVGKQSADVVFAACQGGVGVVDDFADLAESPTIDDCRQSWTKRFCSVNGYVDERSTESCRRVAAVRWLPGQAVG